MAIYGKVRNRVRKFFNPESIDSTGFRKVMMLGMMGLMLGELVVYILLKQSTEVGELPNYITDALIISISSMEFLLGPLLGWLGSEKHRTMMVVWFSLALVCTVPLFALPGPKTIPDAGFDTGMVPWVFSAEISPTAAVRLSLLLMSGLTCALGRLAVTAHGLAYLKQLSPSESPHMHIGMLVMNKVLLLLAGNAVLKEIMLTLAWLQVLLICIKILLTVIQLHRYPAVAPTVDGHKQPRSEKNFFRSIGRVLSNHVAMLQIVAMSLLAAALWGYGVHEAAVAKAKYHIVADNDGNFSDIPLKYLPVALAVLLASYMYSGPIMPKYDRKAAVRNAAKMSLFATLVYVLMTAYTECSRGEVAGLGDFYNQPACGRQNCGRDHLWTEFSPVCVPDQMMTYFSPCHAGCDIAETLNGVGVYSNCTCAPGGRITIGACDDGSCMRAYHSHQLLFVAAAILSSLAFVWQGTVVIESVDRRDVAVAAGFASGVVSLVAFVGAHGFYLGKAVYTCAFERGSECLLQNDQFAPWVGYSSASLAGLSMLFSVIAFIVLKRQKEPKGSTEDLRSS